MAREQGRDPDSFPTVRRAKERVSLVSVPDHLLPIWEAFGVLNRSRGSGFSGPERLALVDIVAARDLLDLPHGLRFAKLIQAMDEAYFRAFAERTEKRSKPKPQG